MNLAETAFLYKEGDGYNLRWFTPNSEVDLCGHATLASAHILWEKGYLRKDQEVKFHTKSGLLTAKVNEGWIELNFPAVLEERINPPAGLLEALGVEAKKYNFVSRFFAPEIGIWEEPVTGSSHTCLGPYWQEKLNKDELIAYQASERGGILRVKVKGDRVLISGKAIPKQYKMLAEASCVIIPLFKQKTDILHSENLSHLNDFASIWCCIENMLLAVTAEGYASALRIPLGDEGDWARKVLKFPEDYLMPCFIAVGKESVNGTYVKQKEYSITERINKNVW